MNTLQRIARVIADQFGVHLELIEDDTDIVRDLGATAAVRFNIRCELQRAFGISLNGEIAERCRTPRQFANLVTNALY